MLQWTKTTLARLRADEKGSFGFIFALLLVPVLAFTGMVVDYARLSAAEDRLQAAVDAGILAAANAGGRTSDMQILAAELIAANMSDAPVAMDTVIDDYEIRIDASFELDMAMLALLGQMSREITASARLVSAYRLSGGNVVAGNGSAHRIPASSGRRLKRGNAPVYLAR